MRAYILGVVAVVVCFVPPLNAEERKLASSVSPNASEATKPKPIEIDELTLIDKNGKSRTYKKLTSRKVEPDGISFMHSSGVKKFSFEELPKDIQQRFNYDPDTAAAYTRKSTIANNRYEARREREVQQALKAYISKRDADYAKQKAEDKENDQRKKQLAADRRQKAERYRIASQASANRAGAIKLMERAMKTRKSRDEAKAMAALSRHAPDMTKVYTDWLSAEAASALKSRIDDLERKLR